MYCICFHCVNDQLLFLCFSLSSLQHLSLNENKLEELPFEMCALTELTELHVANNQLTGLPLEFGFLSKLQKLHLQKNKIRELPEVIFSYVSEVMNETKLSEK